AQRSEAIDPQRALKWAVFSGHNNGGSASRPSSSEILNPSRGPEHLERTRRMAIRWREHARHALEGGLILSFMAALVGLFFARSGHVNRVYGGGINCTDCFTVPVLL